MVHLSQLSGTPWHVEKMTREEGDPRRHRSKCIYYDKITGNCNYKFGRCSGSAHCAAYSVTGYSSFNKNIVQSKTSSDASGTTADSAHAAEKALPIYTPKIIMPNSDHMPKNAKPKSTKNPVVNESQVVLPSVQQSTSKYMLIKADGLGIEEKVTLSSIIVNDRERGKAQDIYRRQMNKYIRCFGKLYRPLMVSYKYGRYYFEDDISYYYSARDMNLQTVTVRTGTQQFFLMERELRQSGRTVNSKTYGKGVIKIATLTEITVMFKTGSRRFSINDCVEKGLLSVQK